MLLEAARIACRTPLQYLINAFDDGYVYDCEKISSPLSAASDVLRFLLRHCPGLAIVRNSDDRTFFDLLPEEEAELT